MGMSYFAPPREPDGQQEGIRWWYPANGEPTVCVQDEQEGLIMKEIPKNGESNDDVRNRLISEIGRVALSLREKLSADSKPSDTMPQ